MTFIDATKIREPADADEALALHMLYAEPGEVVWLHGDWCRKQIGCDMCTCKPRALTVGAKEVVPS